jgi:hypothetical protein
MNAIKQFTRSVTLFIVIPTVVWVIPFVMAKIGQLIGLWAFIDHLYPMAALFWLSLVVTRVAFMYGWYNLGEQFVEQGQEHGFFWFKPDRYPHHQDDEPSVDKSGEILMYVMIVIFAFVFAEVAIRLSIWAYPFYLPPPS